MNPVCRGAEGALAAFAGVATTGAVTAGIAATRLGARPAAPAVIAARPRNARRPTRSAGLSDMAFFLPLCAPKLPKFAGEADSRAPGFVLFFAMAGHG